MNFRIFAISIMISLVWALSGCDRAAEDEGAQGDGGSTQAGPGQPAAAVEVGFIELQPIAISRTNELPGRVVAYQVAEIRPQVSGIIQSRLFKEGSYVEQGQQLYQIDPARYEADYAMAEAGLADAQARNENAVLVFNRSKRLLEENAISRQAYDDALSRLNQTRAAVGLAEAEVKRAQINLDYTRVHSPISGYIGPSALTTGALVSAQQQFALATVRQLDPVYIDLSQTAAQARMLQARLAEARLDDMDKTTFKVTLYPGNSSRRYRHEGTLDATDLAVDSRTGAIRLRSTFPNPDRLLLPGLFVRASVEDVGRSREILIPQKSVRIEPNGEQSVWVIDADNTAVKRSIRTGAAHGNHWVVLNGLEPGERLIVEGTMNLREGAPVKPEKIEIDTDQLEKDVPPDTLNEQVPAPEDPPPANSEDAHGESAAAIASEAEQETRGQRQ
ncbi:MAG: efflux RND transporter periplasmic adaptor subunit [Wenzhouxiangellaceae bacterium]|nr:efflux RND transporter periplasmic adaptor subunit [Wenzhouxiangellaceae bacterium]